MFSKAYRIAAPFTRPLVTSTRLHNGDVRTETATFTVVNDEGWVITAGHVFDSFVKFQSDQNKMKEIEEINSKRSNRNSVIKIAPDSITNHSFWWGWDGVIMRSLYVNRQTDIAAVKLEGLDGKVSGFPVFADEDRVCPGTSLCRMGYAFSNIKTIFNEESKNFGIPAINHSELLFPNDCMHVRTVDRGRSKDGNHPMVYIETSTPGLMGQSGGPIFDVEGRVHAMQVNTAHYDTGFHPKAEYEGKSLVENQFMNIGVGLSVRSIRDVLDSKGIRYSAEGDESGFRIVG